MANPGDGSTSSYAAVLILQGSYRFYSAAMPIEELAATCFVTTREEDPEKGFQRVLDEKRAEEIAKYIDSGTGTIPTAVILSAQSEADFEYFARTKTISFKSIPKAFLVLDGQHRVWGFRKADTNLRVPVIIYSNLNRQLESKLFIDINTKQRPVSNELLLDIKKLAAAESDFETYAGTLFDLFNKTPNSNLKGRLSPDKRSKGLLSRVTFYRAIKNIMPTIGDIVPEQIYPVLNNYLHAIEHRFKEKKIPTEAIVQPTVFGSFVMLFPEVAAVVGDKYDKKYVADNFTIELAPVFDGLKKSQLDGGSVKELKLEGGLTSEALLQFWLADLLVARPQPKQNLLYWVTKGNYQPYNPPISVYKFELAFTPENAPFQNFACEYSRFSCAAFETCLSVNKMLPKQIAKSSAWIAIHMYYAAFYSAHALIRLTGVSCSQFDSPSFKKINDTIALFHAGAPTLVSGYHLVKLGPQNRELKFERSTLRPHHLLWRTFLELLDNIIKTLKDGTTRYQLVLIQLESLKQILTSNGSMDGTWLSDVRNNINYKLIDSAWFPYKESDRKVVEKIRATAEQSWHNSLNIDLTATPKADQTVKFLAACSYLVSLCGEVTGELNSRLASKVNLTTEANKLLLLGK